MGSSTVEDATLTTGAAPTNDPSAGSRRRPRILALAAVLLVAVAVTAAVVLGSRSPRHTAPGTGVPVGETTTTVTRRTLTESATVDGTLGYSGSSELYDRLAEAGTFTWLPAVGALVGRGGTLFRVNNLPVALMYGSVPAYRTLKQGVADGPDVTELNENLVDLGFDPYGAISDYDYFGEGTAAAVRRWQQAEGLAQTGRVELGRVVFAPGAQRVTELHVALGQDPPGDPPAEEPAAKNPGSKQNTKQPREGKQSPKEAAPKKSTPSEPAAKDSPSKPAASADEGASGDGAAGSAGMVVLSTTSTQQIVALQVKANDQGLVHVGEPAPVTLPGGGVVQGHITNVGTVATEPSEEKGSGEKGASPGGSGSGESATVPVTLVLDHRVAHLDEAPVSVELVKSIRREVLAAPATALIATAGGGYAIETLQGARHVDLAVTPGMFAGGYVQVEGPGVREGLTVIESQ